MLGATGSGKSFLLNFLVTHAQQVRPVHGRFRSGHSYRKLATLLHGRLRRSSGCASATSRINPFCAGADARAPALPARVRPRAARGRRRLSAERARGSGTLRGRREPLRARPRVSAGSSRSPTCCRARWRRGSSKWVEGGRYADLFDNVEDTLTFERLQVFDFEAMRAYPGAARAAAVLHPASRERARARRSRRRGR